MNFLNKSCGEWDKVKKPVVVPISYEVHENDDSYNMCNVVRNSNSGEDHEDEEYT